MKAEPLLLLNDARGIYIPRDFTIHVARSHVANVSDEDWAILEAGPDHEHYWEAWEIVTNNAVVTAESGTSYTLHQDGDLWLIPVGMEWDHDEDQWRWPS